MESDTIKSKQIYKLIFLWGVVFLFFFQLLTEFVEGIYLYGLLGTDIPPEIGLVVFLLSPFLLVFARKKVPVTAIKILASVGLIARCVEIFLPTRGRMIVSGIGLVGLLLYIPLALVLDRNHPKQKGYTRTVGMGLSLAIFVQMLLRALLSGSDLSAYGGYRFLSLGLAAIALIILWRFQFEEEIGSTVEKPVNRMRVLGYCLGLFGVLVVLYFAIVAPNVVARWAGVSGISVFVVLLVSWGVVGWWWLNKKSISKTTLFVLGLLFVLALLFSILPHQISFPADMNTGYPLLEPDISIGQIIPLYLMLILSPVLLLIFVHYLDELLAEQPKISLLGVGFGLGGGFTLIMVLAQVFTSVYDYIPVVGPFFRDKFWLVFLIPGLIAVLPLLFASKVKPSVPEVSKSVRQSWLMAVGGMAIATVAGLLLITANPTPPTEEPTSFRIFTYNIQQGYNDLGERNFDGQIALVQSTHPDIIGLQESDTARIAGGNADVVGYFADQFGMYSYYGPSPVTGTFGIALLSRYPIENPHTYYLYSKGEQIAVIEADITVAGKVFKVYVTHLGNGGPIIQMQQMLDLMRGNENVIAMGDFNFRPYEEQYAITVAEYDDSYDHAAESVAPTTWGESGLFEIGERIDHVFVSPGMQVLSVEYFTENESDHPGLFVELELLAGHGD